MSDDARQPWERRADESTKAFAAFHHYLHQPPEKRNVLEAYRRYRRSSRSDKVGNPGPFFDRWTIEHRWVERADAWDSHVLSEARRRCGADVERAYLDRLDDLARMRSPLVEWVCSLDFNRIPPRSQVAIQLLGTLLSTELEILSARMQMLPPDVGAADADAKAEGTREKFERWKDG